MSVCIVERRENVPMNWGAEVEVFLFLPIFSCFFTSIFEQFNATFSVLIKNFFVERG